MVTIPPPKVPSTPHNQKQGEGPLPSLTSTLRADNHEQLVGLISLNLPKNTKGSKQRLIFATETLRALLLYHVLPDPKERGRKSISKKANRNNRRGIRLTSEEESLGLTAGNNFNIVGTRILCDDNGRDYSSDLKQTNQRYSTSGNNSKESASETGAFGNLHGQGHDFERDATDEAQVLTYFIHAVPCHVRAVCKHINTCIQSQTIHSHVSNPFDGNANHEIENLTPILQYRIVFLPHMTALAKQILKDEGMFSKGGRNLVSTHVLDIDLIPLDDDVISCLEMPSFRETHMDGTPSHIVTTVAQSLRKVQHVCGTIGRCLSFGPLGEMVLEKMMALSLDDVALGNDEEGRLSENESGEICALMVLDRKVDLVTPLLTPLTYEGLIDDVLHIDAGMIHVNSDIIHPPGEEGTTSETKSSKDDNDSEQLLLPLNDLDTLYVEVRDQHVEKFGSFLQEQAKALKNTHADFSDKNKDLSEIHQFVKQIPIFTQNLRSLTNHIHLAELIKEKTEQAEFRQRWQTERSMVESEACYDVLEDLIASEYPPIRLLRLLCLQSITSGGIKAAKFDALRRDVVQSYG